jgi:hypothetical protein
MGEFKKFSQNHGTFFAVLVSHIMKMKTLRREMVKGKNREGI